LTSATSGELRVRATKTGTTAKAPSGADDVISTDDDQAARLAELEPVGTWRELVIGSAPMAASLPDTFPLKGWMSVPGKGGATVGAARKASGDCAR